MGKIFFDIGISLDGFIAGENRRPDNPLGDNGISIHDWMFRQKAFQDYHGMPGGTETGIDNELVKDSITRAGTCIMGKRMFEEGEANWPEDLFKTDVYVLTHIKREPWIQKGSTTFYFINDGPESALEKAKRSAGEKDIRIQGGAYTIQQFFNMGLVDDCIVHVAPLMLGKGLRLFENMNRDIYNIEITDTIPSGQVTHIRYRFNKK